jgi:hypothetical protein
MIEIVLLSQQLVSLSENSLLLSIQIFSDHNMACERILIIVESPNVHIVHTTHSFNLTETSIDFLAI